VRSVDDGHHYDVIGTPTTSDDGGEYIGIGQANSGYTADPTPSEGEATDEIDASEPASSGSPVSAVYLHPF